MDSQFEQNQKKNTRGWKTNFPSSVVIINIYYTKKMDLDLLNKFNYSQLEVYLFLLGVIIERIYGFGRVIFTTYTSL